jgi:hypothetical protein
VRTSRRADLPQPPMGHPPGWYAAGVRPGSPAGGGDAVVMLCGSAVRFTSADLEGFAGAGVRLFLDAHGRA